jgi:hypothetical protein
MKVLGSRFKGSKVLRLKSEPQNRRISNNEFRRKESLRFVFFHISD